MTPKRTAEISITNFPSSHEIRPEPLGIVLIIGAWNFPLHSTLEPLVGAIAAGNCVLLKPPSLSAACSRLLGRLVPKYFPTGTVAVLEGGVEITKPILDHPFDHIFYTGGTAVGRIIHSAAARHLTPVTLELGGKCPTVVTESADVDLAARRIAWGKWATNAGQVCVAPDHVFVHSAVADELLKRLKAYITEFFPIGPREAPEYGRIISIGHSRRLAGLVDTDRDAIVVGGECDPDSRFIAPTVLDFGSDTSRFLASASMQNEIFGPVLPLLRFESLDSLTALLVSRCRAEKPLAFYLFTGEGRATIREQFLNRFDSGAAVINDCGMHIVEEGLPFGGVGTSGLGAYHGEKSFDIFTHWRPVLYKRGLLDIPMRYPPMTHFKRAAVRFILWLSRKRITAKKITQGLIVVTLLIALYRTR